MSKRKITQEEMRNIECGKAKIEKYAMVAMQGILSNPNFKDGLRATDENQVEFYTHDHKIMDFPNAVAMEALHQAHALFIELHYFFKDRQWDIEDGMRAYDAVEGRGAYDDDEGELNHVL